MRPSLCTALLLLSPVAALAAPATSVDFSHDDWTIACDNTRTCRAAGYQADDSDPPVSVLLTRKAGAGQAVTAELMLGQYDKVKMPASLSLQIDQRNQGKLALDGKRGTAVLTSAQVGALLAALPRSSKIVALGNDGRRWQLSDRGAAAVLLKMDEFQGRIGTRGALMRKATATKPPCCRRCRHPRSARPSSPQRRQATHAWARCRRCIRRCAPRFLPMRSARGSTPALRRNR